MKKILLFCFCLLSISVFAQQNELAISYQAVNLGTYGQGTSISYYRSITNQSAIGIKFNSNQRSNDYDYSKSFSGSIDLVNRWNLVKPHKKFRILADLGFSVLRDYQELSQITCFCGVLAPGERLPIFSEDHDDWYKTNHFGFASALGFDIQVLKFMKIGATYDYNLYFARSGEIDYDQKTKRSNLNIHLGFNF